jgi:hypothetical protein
MHQTIDKRASESLLIPQKASGDKDICNIKCHIDSNSGTDHRWKGVSPKASTDRGDSEEKGSDHPGCASDKYEDGAREEVKDEATDTGDDTSTYGHRGELGNNLKGGATHYILHAEQILLAIE